MVRGLATLSDIVTRPPPDGLRLDERGLCNWFGQAGTGDSLVYYRGCLSRDRSPTAEFDAEDADQRVATNRPAWAHDYLILVVIRSQPSLR